MALLASPPSENAHGPSCTALEKAHIKTITQGDKTNISINQNNIPKFIDYFKQKSL